MGELLRRHLQETFGREVLFLHGGVPKKQRDRHGRALPGTDPDGPPLFLLSLKAGGTGLNLTARQPRLPLRPLVEPGRREPGHRPRLPHRPDAERAGPQVRLRRHAGGEDRRDDRAQEGGRRLASSGAGEDWLTELSNAELKELLTLRQEAVAER